MVKIPLTYFIDYHQGVRRDVGTRGDREIGVGSMEELGCLDHVFSSVQQFRPRPGQGRTTLCRPVRSFSKLALELAAKGWGGPHRPPGEMSHIILAVLPSPPVPRSHIQSIRRF